MPQLTKPLLFLMAAGLWAYANELTSETAMTRPTIKEVQQRHSTEWIQMSEVVGTAIGRCDEAPCIKVFVSRRTPELARRIPEMLEGYPVVIEVTGEFHAVPEE